MKPIPLTQLDAARYLGISISTLGDDNALSVDHDHKTGKVRGLLCSKCNFGVERLDNCIGWTRKAEKYIAEHKEKCLQ